MGEDYDVIVLGGGPVGENVAERVVAGGLTAALVESELLGGECSYWACMPSKALLRSGTALRAARAVPGAAEAITGELDPSAVLRRRDAFTSHWRDAGQRDWAEGRGIDVVRGRGRIAGERTVEVTPTDAGTTDAGNPGQLGEGLLEPYRVTARHAVVVCTGSEAAIPPIPGLADAGTWTNREATSADTLPQRLTVIGGGTVGCELAQAWNDLGTRVTLIEQSDRLLPVHEPYVGPMISSALRNSGVRVLVRSEVVEVRQAGDDGPYTVRLAPAPYADSTATADSTASPTDSTVTADSTASPADSTATPKVASSDDQDDPTAIESDAVLVATGRIPRTRNLGLESVGLVSGNWLVVDDSGRVRRSGDDWLYAAGDVTGQALLTHMGKYAARITADAIQARARGAHAHPVSWSPYATSAMHAAVTTVVFTDPEVASVGLTEGEARQRGIGVRVLEQEIAVAGSALLADGYTGRVKIVLDNTRQIVIGFTAVDPGAAELLHAATIAIVGEVPLARLRHAVPAFPTLSEFWLRLMEGLGI